MAINIDGDGLIALGGTSTTQGRLRLAEDTDNGTNFIELTAPASVGSDRTITFPDATTTVVGTDATQTLTNKSIVATQLTGTVAAARLPAGSVLQVVSTSKNDVFSTSSTSFVDITGFSASITPSSSSNKILIICDFPLVGATATSGANFDLQRGVTSIGQGTGASTRNVIASIFNLSSAFLTGTSFNFLDSPSTTSSTTYKVQVLSASAGQTVFINRRADDTFNVSSCNLTLLEIAA